MDRSIAYEGSVHDVLARRFRLCAEGMDQFIDALNEHSLERLGIFLARNSAGEPGDNVLSVCDLRVHYPFGCYGVRGFEVHQVSGEFRGPYVYGESQNRRGTRS